MVLIVVELVFGTWFSSKANQILINGNIPAGVTWEFPYFLGNNKVQTHTYIRNAFGLREDIAFGAKKIVLIFGGSNVDQRRIAVEETTGHVVNDYLQNKTGGRVAAVNLGIDGHTLLGNLYSLINWTSFIIDRSKEISGVILTLSINDAAFYYVEKQINNPIEATESTLRKKSGIFRLSSIVWNLIEQKFFRSAHIGHEPLQFEQATYKRLVISNKAKETAKINGELYRKTLLIFIDKLNLKNKSNLLCVTHPNVLGIKHDRNSYLGFEEVYENKIMQMKYNSLEVLESYRILAEIMKEECIKAGGSFQDIDKADSFNAMKKTEYFYNVAHLNMIGERIYNKLLIDTIDKRGIFTTGHALQTE